jgi:hypothetical protein
MISPADIRDMNFERLKTSLEARRRGVYLAWLARGPGTTRQVAKFSGIDLLNVRPRTHELLALGLLKLVRRDGHDGVYRAMSQAEWEAWRAAQFPTTGAQLQLGALTK